MMQERLTSSTKDTKTKKALKEVAEATTWEKGTTLEAVEGRARD